MKTTTLLAALALSLPSAALADSGALVTLTPEQVEAAKEAGARRNAEAATLGIEHGRDRAIHGEVGFAIGTGGYNALFGSAYAPIGDDAYLDLSLARAAYGRRRNR